MDALLWISICAILSLQNASVCNCEAEYQLFPGFGRFNSLEVATDAATTEKDTTITTIEHTDLDLNYGTDIRNTSSTVTLRETFTCEETEHPSHIGPYEVPSQRDLVLHIKKKLTKLYNTYHRKTLRFLGDIQQATRATVEIEKKCSINSRQDYKKCVKRVSKQSEAMTKSLVVLLEIIKHDVMAITEAHICNITAMQVNPVQLIKVMAMEKASLEFALPEFLRLLNACSSYCTKPSQSSMQLKPIRHMTDQDLVVKHFLTRKDYVQLIKGT